MAAFSSRRFRTVASLLSVVLALWASLDLLAADETPSAVTDPAEFTAEQIEFFESKIRPLLIARCHECHAGETSEGSLRLDSRAALIAGGDTGPAIELAEPAASLLLDAVRYGDLYQMPPSGPLPPEEVKLLETWIADGAPWPAEDSPAAASAAPKFDLQARKASHWAWQPIVVPELPTPRDGNSPSPIDALLTARLERAQLQRAPQAAPAERLRRARFDLTGLPPEPAEIAAFLAGASPAAWERAVDRLLASPRFGERWARHWLDVVRYAETLGHESDFPLTNAWRYRDYVIRAFNDDLPYDQFVREHLAGDLIEPPRRHPTERFNESILATAFWYLGEAVHAPVDARADQATRLENQVDVLSKAFLGLTVACARCHDHKFDAISTKDYYSLAGIAASSHQQVARLSPHDEFETAAPQLRALHRRGREVLRGLGLSEQSVNTGEQRYAPTSANEVTFENFDASFDGWYRTGWAFGSKPTRDGDWRRVAEDVELLPAGIAHSGRFGDRLPGVIRSPTFTIERPFVHYRVAGRGSKVRLIVDGYALDPFTAQLFEGFSFDVAHEKFHWHTQDASRYLGHRARIELVDPGAGYVAVDEIRFSDAAAVTDAAELAAPVSTTTPVELAAVCNELKQIDDALPEPVEAVAIGDGSGDDLAIHIRGNYRTPGPAAPRQLLEALVGDAPPTPSPHSGRLELADQLLATDNPFVARVMVNRVWAHLFGRGIVPTVDNFGALGEPPTHPELLDYLAARFVEEGWSVKRLIREIMLSEAYQLASVGHSASDAVDPQNRLYHRANVRRLEGEAIRDSLLAIAGSLDEASFGPPVPIHLTTFMQGRGRPATSGPLDGDGRRSIYLEVRRNFLSPFLLAFDTPVPATCVGQRSSSNVPAQALTLMNDPFVHEQCQRWARRVLAEPSAPAVEERVNLLYLAAFGRAATDEEVATAAEFVRLQAIELDLPPDDERLWTDLCHVLVNVKEFIYLK